MSFLGGRPEYLQQESDDFLEKYIFIGQILGMDLPEKVNEIFYLTENIGYIFINRDLSGGLFFVQNNLNKTKKDMTMNEFYMWVVQGSRASFPSAIFSTKEKAVQWIEKI